MSLVTVLIVFGVGIYFPGKYSVSGASLRNYAVVNNLALDERRGFGNHPIAKPPVPVPGGQQSHSGNAGRPNSNGIQHAGQLQQQQQNQQQQYQQQNQVLADIQSVQSPGNLHLQAAPLQGVQGYDQSSMMEMGAAVMPSLGGTPIQPSILFNSQQKPQSQQKPPPPQQQQAPPPSYYSQPLPQGPPPQYMQSPPPQSQGPPQQSQYPPQSQGPPQQSQYPPPQSQGPPLQYMQSPPPQSQGPPQQSQYPPPQSQGPPQQSQSPPSQSQGPPQQTQYPPVQSQVSPQQSQSLPAQPQNLPQQSQSQGPPQQTQSPPPQSQISPQSVQSPPEPHTYQQAPAQPQSAPVSQQVQPPLEQTVYQEPPPQPAPPVAQPSIPSAVAPSQPAPLQNEPASIPPAPVPSPPHQQVAQESHPASEPVPHTVHQQHAPPQHTPTVPILEQQQNEAISLPEGLSTDHITPVASSPAFNPAPVISNPVPEPIQESPAPEIISPSPSAEASSQYQFQSNPFSMPQIGPTGGSSSSYTSIFDKPSAFLNSSPILSSTLNAFNQAQAHSEEPAPPPSLLGVSDAGWTPEVNYGGPTLVMDSTLGINSLAQISTTHMEQLSLGGDPANPAIAEVYFGSEANHLLTGNTIQESSGHDVGINLSEGNIEGGGSQMYEIATMGQQNEVLVSGQSGSEAMGQMLHQSLSDMVNQEGAGTQEQVLLQLANNGVQEVEILEPEHGDQQVAEMQATNENVALNLEHQHNIQEMTPEVEKYPLLGHQDEEAATSLASNGYDPENLIEFEHHVATESEASLAPATGEIVSQPQVIESPVAPEPVFATVVEPVVMTIAPASVSTPEQVVSPLNPSFSTPVSNSEQFLFQQPSPDLPTASSLVSTSNPDGVALSSFSQNTASTATGNYGNAMHTISKSGNNLKKPRIDVSSEPIRFFLSQHNLHGIPRVDYSVLEQEQEGLVAAMFQ